MYSETTGKDLSQDWEFYMVYSLFKVACICGAFSEEFAMEQLQANMQKKEASSILEHGQWSKLTFSINIPI